MPRAYWCTPGAEPSPGAAVALVAIDVVGAVVGVVVVGTVVVVEVDVVVVGDTVVVVVVGGTVVVVFGGTVVVVVGGTVDVVVGGSVEVVVVGGSVVGGGGIGAYGDEITIGRYRCGLSHASRRMLRALLDTVINTEPYPSRHGRGWA